ncbi:hypothetical protein BRC2024_PQPTKSFJ_CDS_0138 [Tegunavirus sp. BRC001]
MCAAQYSVFFSADISDTSISSETLSSPTK